MSSSPLPRQSWLSWRSCRLPCGLSARVGHHLLVGVDWQAEVADGLTPQEVCAGLRMGSVRSSDLPNIASWWLADGRDTTALRELGGASPGDAWALDGLWLRVCDEIGVTALDDEGAARIDVRRTLSEWKVRRRPTSEVLRALDQMGLYRFGLDTTAGLLDELEAPWGRSEVEVLVDADGRLHRLAEDLGERSGWPGSQ